ncbi:MAG: cobalamin-dependent protein [Anaerolineae bacterium]|nr:cobalamin-dependent protein [Anaerolineae bacterium]
MPGKINVGWVHINTGMYMTRTRPDKTRLFWGSMAPPPDSDANAESDHWEALPYAVGLLQAYVQQHAPDPDRYTFLLPIHKRIPVEQAVAHLGGANVVGFSVYVWNIRLSLAIARQIKERQPDTLIVFGGPQVPMRAEAFLRQHPWVDIVCHGEGEQVFLSILENCQTRNWDGIPSISYIRPDETFAKHPLAYPIQDLSTIPSPYLTGVFDPLMQANPNTEWMALWETNRGCPFSCSFCSWDSRANRVHKFDQERLFREIEWMAEHQIEYIHCCDANYGLWPRDLDIAQYIAQAKEQQGYPKFFFVENDSCFRERTYQIHNTLHRVGLNGTVILAVQSMDVQTLKNVNRKTSIIQLYQEVQQRFARDGIETLTEMILALPGETYDSFTDGISQVIEQGGHHGISCYNCSILPCAEMAEPAYQARFGMRTVSQQAIAMHSAVTGAVDDDVPEFMETVIATDSMPETDWVKAKAFLWMTDLLHFGRVLRIPFVLLHQLYAISYWELVEAIALADPDRYPLLASVQAMFLDKARAIQQGGPEYFPSGEWLGIWWPADQYVLIKLAMEWELDEFYRQAEHALAACLQARAVGFDPALLHEAIELNRHLFIRPFNLSNLTIEQSYNVWETYHAAMTGDPVRLEQKPNHYRILRMQPLWLTWEDWFEFLVFCYHNRNFYWYRMLPVKSKASAHG